MGGSPESRQPITPMLVINTGLSFLLPFVGLMILSAVVLLLAAQPASRLSWWLFPGATVFAAAIGVWNATRCFRRRREVRGDRKPRGGIAGYFAESLPGYLALFGTFQAAAPWVAYYSSPDHHYAPGEPVTSARLFWSAVIGAALWGAAIWLEIARRKQSQKSRGGVITYFVGSLPGYLGLAGTFAAVVSLAVYYSNSQRPAGRPIGPGFIAGPAIVGTALWIAAVWLEIARRRQKSVRERLESDVARRGSG